MAQLILTRNSQFHRALRTRSTFPLTFKVGRFFLLFTLTFMIGILSFFYLIKSTEIHTKGFQLRRLEIEKDHLVGIQESKNTDIAKLKSLHTIRESAVTSFLVPLRNPVFIKKDGSISLLEKGELQ